MEIFRLESHDAATCTIEFQTKAFYIVAGRLARPGGLELSRRTLVVSWPCVSTVFLGFMQSAVLLDVCCCCAVVNCRCSCAPGLKRDSWLACLVRVALLLYTRAGLISVGPVLPCRRHRRFGQPRRIGRCWLRSRLGLHIPMFSLRPGLHFGFLVQPQRHTFAPHLELFFLAGLFQLAVHVFSVVLGVMLRPLLRYCALRQSATSPAILKSEWSAIPWSGLLCVRDFEA